MLGRATLFVLTALAAPAEPHAPVPALAAAMDCRNEPGTGRLLCTIELDVPRGKRLAWSDALVVAAPKAARPLRSRVPGTGRPPRRIELGFVLGAGEGGRIEVVARAVVCPAGERRREACASASRRVGFDVPAR